MIAAVEWALPGRASERPVAVRNLLAVQGYVDSSTTVAAPLATREEKDMAYTEQFKSLVRDYLDEQIEFPALREVTIAQWTLESGYGGSDLAKEFLNFAGLKW